MYAIEFGRVLEFDYPAEMIYWKSSIEGLKITHRVTRSLDNQGKTNAEFCVKHHVDIDDMIIKHDGAPVHTANSTVSLLERHFPQRWIGASCRDATPFVGWPARSNDLNPVSFFYWKNIQDRIYNSEIISRYDLEDRIRRAAATDEGQGWINCLRAMRAILWHHEVPPNLYELVWQSKSTFLSTHDDVYAGPRCHEETWEPEEEGICPICHRLFSKPPPPAGPWFLAGPWD
ncbi:unnamed protein product [Trichogramma brassicae]|uniref:Tc1-like transposase DDE domain-containing protein n=1 Tax=Trichogramma brassicae TaxID=86971 RepID=A0A6H5J4W6_9HYME|nr:unnamed protein product [Trichogramma brassicae]